MNPDSNTPPAAVIPGPEVVPPTASALLDFVEPRAHATPNTSVDPAVLQQPLAEAPIGMSSATIEEDPFLKEIDAARASRGQQAGPGPTAAPPKSGGGKSGSSKGPAAESFTNPDLKGLSPEKSREAAENLAKLLIQGYCRLTDFGDKQLQVSEKKMLKIRTAGKIDMDTAIPIEGGEMSFEEFIRTYNEQARGTLTVEPEFVEDVLPRLTSVLAKRGQGLSDEQYLIGAFVGHMGINIQKFTAMKSTLNSFMAFGMEMTKRNRDEGRTYARPQQEYTPPPAPPPAPGPAPAPQGPPPAARVVPMHNEYTSQGAAEEYKMPEWGGKDRKKTLANASRKARQNARGAGGPITDKAPTSRRKIPRKTSKAS